MVHIVHGFDIILVIIMISYPPVVFVLVLRGWTNGWVTRENIVLAGARRPGQSARQAEARAEIRVWHAEECHHRGKRANPTLPFISGLKPPVHY